MIAHAEFDSAFSATVAIDAEAQHAIALARHAAAQSLLQYFTTDTSSSGNSESAHTDAHAEPKPDITRLRLAIQITMRRFVPYEHAVRTHLKTNTDHAAETTDTSNATPNIDDSSSHKVQRDELLNGIRAIAEAEDDAQTCAFIDALMQQNEPDLEQIESLQHAINATLPPPPSPEDPLQQPAHEASAA